MCGLDYEKVIEKLREKYTLYLIDCFGHGESEKKAELYRCRIIGEAIADFIRNEVGKPCIVTDTKKAMTDEQFVEMVKTGNLSQLEKEGYMFAEWRDQSDNVITEWKAEGVKEIKPVWEKDIQITFDPNGGTCDTVPVRPMENGKLNSLPAAKKDGVCFDGWITQSGDKVTADTVFTEPTTLKASWVEESSRAEALAEFMDEQGFSQKSIDRHTGMLSNGITASFFGMGNIWMIIAIIFIIISVILFAVIRKKANESEDV